MVNRRSFLLSSVLLFSALLFPALAFAAFTPSTHIILKLPAEGSVVPLRPDRFAWHDDSTRPTVPGSNPPHAAPYRLRICTEPGFPSEAPTVFPIDPLPPYAIDTYVYDTVLDVAAMHAPLSPNTTYYWGVSIPADSGGDVSIARGSFITEDLPLSPELESPADSEVNVPLGRAFVWNKSDRATRYRLQVAFDYAFTTGVLDTLVSDTAATFPSFAYNQFYYWRVRGENSGGVSPWSEVRRFTVIGPVPGRPLLKTPAKDSLTVDTTYVHFLWENAPVDSTHGQPLESRVQLATDTYFSAPILDTLFIPIDSIAIGPKGLVGDTRYFWRVRGENTAGPGPWSDVFTFTTIGSPAAILPKDFTLRFLDAPGGSHLSYGLPKATHVTVRLHDFRGVLRAMPLDGEQPEGIHELSLPALPRGVYYLSFRAGDFRRQTRVILDR